MAWGDTRKLADSKYNERRGQCEEALKILQNNGVKIDALCQLTPADWEKYSALVEDPILNKRAHHCIAENQRVIDAASTLKAGNLEELGRLLNATHKSLKEDYEVLICLA